MKIGIRQQAVGNSKKLKLVVCVLCAMLFALCLPASAQQPTKVPRIGYLSAGDAAGQFTPTEAIRLALHELGYIEGQNIVTEYRYADGKLDWLPELAAELVRLKVDIIVVSGGGRSAPGGQECDQDDFHRYGERWVRSCRGRSGWKPGLLFFPEG